MKEISEDEIIDIKDIDISKELQKAFNKAKKSFAGVGSTKYQTELNLALKKEELEIFKLMFSDLKNILVDIKQELAELNAQYYNENN